MCTIQIPEWDTKLKSNYGHLLSITRDNYLTQDILCLEQKFSLVFSTTIALALHCNCKIVKCQTTNQKKEEKCVWSYEGMGGGEGDRIVWAQ